MPQRKYDHHDEAIVLANLHLPPREIELLLNRARSARGASAVTFSRANKQDFKRKKQDSSVLDQVPELEAEQRARELKAHLDTLQVAIQAFKRQASVEGAQFGKGEARELANLSREFRNTLKDIGDLSPALIAPKKAEPEAPKTAEEKYAEQLPPNVVAIRQPG